MFKIQYLNKSILLTVPLLLLSGCASNASVNQMIYRYQSQKSPVYKEFLQNIGIKNVNGGRQTNPLLTSQVDNPGFEAALKDSLQYSKLYQKLSKAHYALNADLLALQQPVMGLDMTVVAVVRYKLTSLKHNKIIFDKVIRSRYTASFGDNLIGYIRLKDANEGAIRNNIGALIKYIYRKKVF